VAGATVAAALVVAALAAGCGSGGGEEPARTTAASTTTRRPTTVPVASTTGSTATTATTAAPSSTTEVGSTALPPTTSSTAVPGGAAVEVRRGPTDARAVALTFDAGSDRGFAADILDTLAREHIAAAFGMTGTWAADNPDLVRRMVAEGHLLLNHTQDHRSFTGYSTATAPLTAGQRIAELRGAEDAVRAAARVELPPYFRPPYGDSDDGVLRDLATAGYRWSILWTVDSLGWKGLSAHAIVDRCVQGAVPGAIYLFHVGSQSQDAAALGDLIAALRAGGYRFERVDRFVPG
jgi:peptidoglycan/xylan/chitin deacetylase (PgdA/CDA1 family)